MIFDGEDEHHTLGKYGAGLADALAHKHGMLQDLPDVTAFKAVKLSVGGGFQFDMNVFQTDSPILCDYLRMAAVIRQHYGFKPVAKQVSCALALLPGFRTLSQLETARSRDRRLHRLANGVFHKLMLVLL